MKHVILVETWHPVWECIPKSIKSTCQPGFHFPPYFIKPWKTTPFQKVNKTVDLQKGTRRRTKGHRRSYTVDGNQKCGIFTHQLREVGSWNHTIYKVLAPSQVVGNRDFWTINSIYPTKVLTPRPDSLSPAWRSAACGWWSMPFTVKSARVRRWMPSCKVGP